MTVTDKDFELINKGVEIGKDHTSSSLQTINMIKDIKEDFDKTIERHEEKQDESFEKVYKQINDFAKTKMDKDLFMWIVGAMTVAMLILAGSSFAQSLDINTIKTTLDLAVITHE